MSDGICLECGTAKNAALMACPQCGHVPTDALDRTRHLYVTLELDEEQRSSVAERARSGRTLGLDANAVAEFGAEVESIGEPPLSYILAMTMAPMVVLVVVTGALFCLLSAG